MRTRKIAARAAAGLLVVATRGFASQGYGASAKTALDLSYEPACTTCHLAGSDGGASRSRFGEVLFRAGAVGGDAGSLDRAFERLRAEGADGDDDGAQDLDELSWGGDPNIADLPEGREQRALEYGCATQPRTRRGVGPAAGLVVLAAVFAWWRRGPAAL